MILRVRAGASDANGLRLASGAFSLSAEPEDGAPPAAAPSRSMLIVTAPPGGASGQALPEAALGRRGAPGAARAAPRTG